MARTVIPWVAPEPSPPPAQETAWGRRGVWATLVLVALALLVWTALANSRGRALRRMPVAARQTLFVRVTENAKVLCSSGQAGLEEDCESQLEFLADFPECDQACETLIATYGPPPTR